VTELTTTLVAVGGLVSVVTAGQLIVIRYLVGSFSASLDRNTDAILKLSESLE